MNRPPIKPNARRLTSEDRRVIWWGRFKGFLQVCLGLALVVGSAFLSRELYREFRSTPYLHVKSLEVRGNTQADEMELRVLSGPIIGTHLLDLRLDWAKESILRHPWLATATFEVEWPDRVILTVTEREPVAILTAEKLYYVDAQGKPFVKVKPGQLMDLPIVTGLENQDSPLRKDGHLAQKSIVYALELAQAIQDQTPELGDLSEVHIDLEEGYSFFLNDGSAEVLLGFEDFSVKLIRLSMLMDKEDLDLKTVGRVNLDLDRAAVVSALPNRTYRR